MDVSAAKAGRARAVSSPDHDEGVPSAPGFSSVPRAGRLRRFLFGIAENEASFARRGFGVTTPERQARLEGIGRSFVAGYNAALETPRAGPLGRKLRAFARERQGFAFEGAAMALALLDILESWLLPYRRLAPRRRLRWDRLTELLESHGDRHAYMIHVGAGWAAARLRVPLDRYVERFDPLLRWLVADGFGFHHGYFGWRRTIVARATGRGIEGYAARAFDQGLGRSLWFVEGARVGAIVERVLTFPPPRRPDLWSGVGLAAAYAGGAEPAELDRLRAAAGDARAHLAQGAAFAAKARLRADLPAPHTEIACRHLCGVSMAVAAGWTDAALHDLLGAAGGPPSIANAVTTPAFARPDVTGAIGNGEREPYEIWRSCVRRSYLDTETPSRAVNR